MSRADVNRSNRIAVIGGGWAGLAAAVELRDAGCRVTVFEAGRTPGGRARRVEREEDAVLDNGQHILLGAYRDTLALMRRLGRDPDRLFVRTPLCLQSADGRFRLAIPSSLTRLPAPLPALCALLSARGLSVKERYAALRLMRHLHAAGWRAPPDCSVAQWLARHRQPLRLQDRLWTPLCLAALNTPPEYASAVLFAAVLRDALARHAEASDLLLPRTDLSSLWPDAAIQRVDWRPGHRVRAIVNHPRADTAACYTVDGQPCDAIVLAVPPDAAATLLANLPSHPGQPALLAALTAFEYLPIATATLTLAAPWRLPAPMLMGVTDPARGHYGQWLFDRAALMGRTDVGELTVVISAANGLPERNETLQRVEQQIREQTRRHDCPTMPAVVRRTLITEKRATFAATPGLARPAALTAWPGLVLAGDWTDTGYPGVLEGAVRSGLTAAQAVLDYVLAKNATPGSDAKCASQVSNGTR